MGGLPGVVAVALFSMFPMSAMAGPPPLSLKMVPNAPSGSCESGGIGGEVFGSTTSTTGVYVGRMFFEEIDNTFQATPQSLGSDPLGNNGPGLGLNYSIGRLVLACRGSGVIELVSNCQNVIATINCVLGSRPWSAASETFGLGDAVGGNQSWNLRVRANPGETMEWANPLVLLTGEIRIFKDGLEGNDLPLMRGQDPLQNNAQGNEQ